MLIPLDGDGGLLPRANQALKALAKQVRHLDKEGSAVATEAGLKIS